MQKCMVIGKYRITTKNIQAGFIDGQKMDGGD